MNGGTIMAKPFKRKSRDELKKEITDRVDDAFELIQQYTRSKEDVIELSQFMAEFYHYSPRNMALIRKQFPHAQAVGSFMAFSDKGFQIKKGEKAIKILVPTPVTTFVTSNGKEKNLRDATPEEKAKIKQGTYKTEKMTRYRLGNVFDVSQTTATIDDLPSIFPNRHYHFSYDGQASHLFKALEAVGKDLDTPIRDMKDSVFSDKELGAVQGQFIYSEEKNMKEIRLNSRLSETDKIHVTIHELAHAMLHQQTNSLTTADKEFQAELTSHIVCHHFNIDTTEASIPYIASWTGNGQNLTDKARLIADIHQAARTLINNIHQHFDDSQLSTNEQQPIEPEKKPTKTNQSITKTMIEEAKKVSIIDFATSQGVELIQRAKNEYRLVDNNSVALFPRTNTFVDFEPTSDLKGDTIEFARRVVGIDSFEEAVKLLNNEEFERVELVSEERAAFSYDTEKESPSFEKARHYLVNERQLNEKLVDHLHQKGYIRQDKRGNVLFCWYDENKMVGVTEQGTYKSPNYDRGYWKGIQKNSPAFSHGFNVCFGQPQHLKFFEASVDALSYASLNPNNVKNTWLVSMEGLNENKLLDYVKRSHEKLGSVPKSISVCVDNDSSGLSFFKGLSKIKQEFLTNEIPQKPADRSHLEKWDWNDQLKYVATQSSNLTDELGMGGSLDL